MCLDYHMAHRRRLRSVQYRNELPTLYMRKGVIGDFKGLLIRTWGTRRRRKRGLQWVSATPTFPLALSHVLTLLRPHPMSWSDQDFQGILSGPPFSLYDKWFQWFGVLQWRLQWFFWEASLTMFEFLLDWLTSERVRIATRYCAAFEKEPIKQEW